MPLAATHIIITLAVVEGLRRIFRFPKRFVLLGGIFGLLPDLDIPAALVLNLVTGGNYYFHKTYTHSFALALLFFVAAAITSTLRFQQLHLGKLIVSKITLVAGLGLAGVGWVMHNILDCWLSIGTVPSWLPGSTERIGFCRSLLTQEQLIYLDGLLVSLGFMYFMSRSWK
jgi:hypothetical protein